MASVGSVSAPGAKANGQTVEEARQPGRAGGRCQVSGAVVSPLGMSFEPRFSFEDWRQLGPRIALRANASLWWLGDWLAFGQEKYGRRYKAGVALTGLDYQTLRNYVVVARRFELSRRRDKLSFQHHAELCALTDAEQEHWMDRAQCAGWSRNELRRRLRSGGGVRARAGPPSLCLAVEADRRNLWSQAALRDDCDLESWMLRSLDQAATALLGCD